MERGKNVLAALAARPSGRAALHPEAARQRALMACAAAVAAPLVAGDAYVPAARANAASRKRERLGRLAHGIVDDATALVQALEDAACIVELDMRAGASEGGVHMRRTARDYSRSRLLLFIGAWATRNSWDKRKPSDLAIAHMLLALGDRVLAYSIDEMMTSVDCPSTDTLPHKRTEPAKPVRLTRAAPLPDSHALAARAALLRGAALLLPPATVGVGAAAGPVPPAVAALVPPPSAAGGAQGKADRLAAQAASGVTAVGTSRTRRKEKRAGKLRVPAVGRAPPAAAAAAAPAVVPPVPAFAGLSPTLRAAWGFGGRGRQTAPIKLERCGVCYFQGHHDRCGCSGIGRAQKPVLAFAAQVRHGGMTLSALHAGVMRPARLSVLGLCGPVAAGASFVPYAHFPTRRVPPATLASQVEVAHDLFRRGQLSSAVSAYRAALETQRSVTGDAHAAALLVELALLRALAAVAVKPTLGRGAAARRTAVVAQCNDARPRFVQAFGEGKHTHTRELDEIVRSLRPALPLAAPP